MRAAATRTPVWVPAVLVVTAVVAVVIGVMIGTAPAVCHAPAHLFDGVQL